MPREIGDHWPVEQVKKEPHRAKVRGGVPGIENDRLGISRRRSTPAG
jgi:hypothetical protein